MKKKSVSVPGLLIFAFFLLIATGLIWTGFFGKYNPKEIENELSRKERELKRYQSGQAISLTPEAYAVLEKISEKLSNDLESFEQIIQKTNSQIPEGTAMDGLFFREHLFKVSRELQLLASERGVVLPETLGFSDELPDVKRVPLLIHQLTGIQEVAASLIESGAARISVIKPLEIIEHKNPDAGEVVLMELPFQITAECHFQTLLTALIRLRNSPQVLVVREVQIQAKEEEPLQVQIITSAFFTVTALQKLNSGR